MHPACLSVLVSGWFCYRETSCPCNYQPITLPTRRGSWNGGIPEQLCRGHRPIDHHRKLYPFTTATEEGCATHKHADKGHEIKKEKIPEWHTEMRWEHNTAARSVRQRLGLTIMVSTWMNSWREASCVSLNSLRMLKRSTSLLETMMRISALSSVPRPWGWDYFWWTVANIKTHPKTKHIPSMNIWLQVTPAFCRTWALETMDASRT